MISRTLGDIAIIGVENRAIIVDLGVDYQQRPFVKVDDVVGQSREIRVVLIYPRPPIIFSVGYEFFGLPRFDNVVETNRSIAACGGSGPGIQTLFRTRLQ